MTHANIEVEDNKVRSVGAVAHKLCYLESSLGGEKRTFRVRINQDINNWVGLGVCHKTAVDSKQCSFKYNTIGHGCYMVSSNGTVWSSTRPEINGCVKSFKFNKGENHRGPNMTLQ